MGMATIPAPDKHCVRCGHRKSSHDAFGCTYHNRVGTLARPGGCRCVGFCDGWPGSAPKVCDG